MNDTSGTDNAGGRLTQPEPVMQLERVRYAYPRSAPVLDDISFTIPKGVNIGIVGESGAGKTTLLRLMLGLLSPSAGTIRFRGSSVRPGDRVFMRDFRRSVQTIFQDPYSSLDPRQPVRSIVAEPLRSLRIPGHHEQQVSDALASVGLDRDVLNRMPHEFSGGQRQRIAIARAIVAEPELVLADEPVSALDLSTRIRIIDLLKELSLRLTVVLVSHDLTVVAALCPSMVVLDRGNVVEHGDTHHIIQAPEHPYTRKLLSSVPRLPAAKSA